MSGRAFQSLQLINNIVRHHIDLPGNEKTYNVCKHFCDTEQLSVQKYSVILNPDKFIQTVKACLKYDVSDFFPTTFSISIDGSVESAANSLKYTLMVLYIILIRTQSFYSSGSTGKKKRKYSLKLALCKKLHKMLAKYY